MACTLSHKAYCKIALHAAKYPHAAVNGVVVGAVLGDTVLVKDAFPLFHTPSSMGAGNLLQAAFTQIDCFCEEEERCEGGESGLQIVGYYHGNERHSDHELPELAKVIGNKVLALFPQACVLLLDSKRLGAALAPARAAEAEPAVRLFTKGASGGWASEAKPALEDAKRTGRE